MEALGSVQSRTLSSQILDHQPPLDIPVPPHLATSHRRSRDITTTTSPSPASEAPATTKASEAMAMVGEFHTAFGLPCQYQPTAPLPVKLANLRVDLLTEEVNEFIAASKTQDIVGLADALADIVYVAYGAAITYGIDLDAVLREVHRSNMSKLDGEGRAVYRSDGKVMKSQRYAPPDVAGVLGVQAALPL